MHTHVHKHMPARARQHAHRQADSHSSTAAACAPAYARALTQTAPPSPPKHTHFTHTDRQRRAPPAAQALLGPLRPPIPPRPPAATGPQLRGRRRGRRRRATGGARHRRECRRQPAHSPELAVPERHRWRLCRPVRRRPHAVDPRPGEFGGSRAGGVLKDETRCSTESESLRASEESQTPRRATSLGKVWGRRRGKIWIRAVRDQKQNK